MLLILPVRQWCHFLSLTASFSEAAISGDSPVFSQLLTEWKTGTCDGRMRQMLQLHLSCRGKPHLRHVSPSALISIRSLSTSGEARSYGRSAGTRQKVEDSHMSQRKIELIATDVDGTLLDSKHRLSERTEHALKMAMSQGIQVVIATGKSRGPWVSEIFPRLGLSTPAVFLQGLQIYGPDGDLLYERVMDADVSMDAGPDGGRHSYCILWAENTV